MAGPLKGVKVLDFTIYVNGTSATQKLADAGADVVKVELRSGAPERVQEQYVLTDGHRWLHGHLNRGKKSIVIDLKHPRAAEVLEPLVQWADVIANNFRAGVSSGYSQTHHSSRPNRYPTAPVPCNPIRPLALYACRTLSKQKKTTRDIGQIAIDRIFKEGLRVDVPPPPFLRNSLSSSAALAACAISAGDCSVGLQPHAGFLLSLYWCSQLNSSRITVATLSSTSSSDT